MTTGNVGVRHDNVKCGGLVMSECKLLLSPSAHLVGLIHRSPAELKAPIDVISS